MARYFVHIPPNNSNPIYWRGLSTFAGEYIQINLNLLAHAVGDDPVALLAQESPPSTSGATLVGPQDYIYGNNALNDKVSLQPFAFTEQGETTVKALSIGPNLHNFLNEPLGGERMDLSLPFYDENIKLGTNGGGWIRNFNDASAFHAGTDFMPNQSSVFDVCAASDGRVLTIETLAMSSNPQRVVLTHTTPGGQEFRTVYVHMDLSSVSKVVGDPIRRGEFLGRIRPNTSPIHLHFGVAVRAPGFTSNGQSIPPLWHFIDPWGVYDIRLNNYLPIAGRIYDSDIAGVKHTVQWRTQPLYRTIPISRLTDGYLAITSIQVRVRRSENIYGTFPPEHEQFLVWLRGDPDFFMVPMTQASNLTTELELINLLRDAFYHKRRVKLEYRYAGNLRYIMAAWVGG